MIVDNLNNLSNYESVHPRFPKAFAFFKQLLAEGAADGKHIMPDCAVEKEVFVNFMSINTKANEGAACESHKNYIDVQVVLEGENLMCMPIDGVQPDESAPYNAEKDVTHYLPLALEDCYRLPIKAGNFAIFFADELHAPSMSVTNESTPVRKAVIKVLA